MTDQNQDAAPANPSKLTLRGMYYHAGAGLLMTGDASTSEFFQAIFDPEIQTNLAMASGVQRMKEGNVEVAERAFRYAFELSPNRADVIGHHASMLLLKGQTQEAMDLCRRGLEIDPTDFACNGNLGQAHYVLGEHEAAQVYFAKALEKNPKNTKAISSVMINLCYLERFAEALALGEAVPKTDASARTFYALALSKSGDKAASESVLREVLISNPESYMALVNLGHLMFEKGDYQESAELAERAVLLRPQESIPHNNLAECYEKLGRTAEAIAQYNLVLACENVSAKMLADVTQSLKRLQTPGGNTPQPGGAMG